MGRSLVGGVLAIVMLSMAFTTAASHPGSGIVVDHKGQIFFVDNGGGGALWKIDAAGKLSRFREGGWHWLALDERGNYSAEDLKRWLTSSGHTVKDFGATALNPLDDFPDFVVPLAEAVASGEIERGIAIRLVRQSTKGNRLIGLVNRQNRRRRTGNRTTIAGDNRRTRGVFCARLLAVTTRRRHPEER